MVLPKKLQEIIDDFSVLDTSDEKYEALMEFGDYLGDFPDSLKTNENMITGCTSEVYINVNVISGVVKIKGWAQSVLVKGLIAVLVVGLNGLTVDEVLALKHDFILKLGITQSLTASRANTPITVLETIQKRIKQQIS